jgi:hypothetical protein
MAAGFAQADSPTLSEALRPASVILTQATVIFGWRFPMLRSCTVASPPRMRSAIVSNLNPRLSNAFTSRPRGAFASTVSSRRCLGPRLRFSSSVAIWPPTEVIPQTAARELILKGCPAGSPPLLPKEAPNRGPHRKPVPPRGAG